MDTCNREPRDQFADRAINASGKIWHRKSNEADPGAVVPRLLGRYLYNRTSSNQLAPRLDSIADFTSNSALSQGIPIANDNQHCSRPGDCHMQSPQALEEADFAMHVASRGHVDDGVGFSSLEDVNG